MIRFALPTGDLRGDAAAFLAAQGLGSEEYASGARTYRPRSEQADVISFRVFRDRDIAIQVALGNYDGGICTSAAVDELLCRHPNEAIIKLADLPFDRRTLYAIGALGESGTRIVSEYPSLAQVWALRRRVGNHQILPIGGSPLHYLPEYADVAVVAIANDRRPEDLGYAFEAVTQSSACLVANKHALAGRSIAPLFADLGSALAQRQPTSHGRLERSPSAATSNGGLRLALPDGHLQREAPAICRAAGLDLSGYDEASSTGRPECGADLEARVIRPQDMPQFVALGCFDLAVTGRDCLLNHLAQFPSSPVVEVADLKRQRYRWAAVASGELGAASLGDALDSWRGRGRSVIRLASEYPNLADHFARERRLGRYSVVPVLGASEGFVPEDAELLIEGSETGRTWQANNLVPLEWLFESTMIVIARTDRAGRPHAVETEALIERLQRAA